MPGGHVSQRHRLFLHRQLRAGRPKATIARNYRAFQVRLARIRELPSVSTLKRIKRQGGWPDGRPAKRHNIGESLEARHKKLIEERLARFPCARTRELATLLRIRERGISDRTHFAHSTIDDFIRDEMDHTNKVVTVYNARLDLAKSARSRQALKRYPLHCLTVIDASAIRRKDYRRRVGRGKKGKRIYGRTFNLDGSDVLRTLMGVMTIDGMHTGASEILVRVRVRSPAMHRSVPLLLPVPVAKLLGFARYMYARTDR
jgi:hypothetical protein